MIGSTLSYSVSGLLKGLSPLWLDDTEFVDIYRKVKHRILLDPARCFVLLQAARRQKTVPGNIVELGSYRCGSAPFLTANDSATQKTLHIIDSFAGLPEVTDKDPYWKKGEMGHTDFEEIKKFLKTNLINTKHKIYKGFFPQEVDLDALSGPWSLVHIDTDLYQPTLDALRFFWPNLNRGGMIIVDDYGNSSCPGVVSAVKEFEAETGVTAIFLVSGQAMIFKHD